MNSKKHVPILQSCFFWIPYSISPKWLPRPSKYPKKMVQHTQTMGSSTTCVGRNQKSGYIMYSIYNGFLLSYDFRPGHRHENHETRALAWNLGSILTSHKGIALPRFRITFGLLATKGSQKHNSHLLYDIYDQNGDLMRFRVGKIINGGLSSEACLMTLEGITYIPE